MEVRKTNGSTEEFDRRKLSNIIKKAYKKAGVECTNETAGEIIDSLYIYDGIMCSSIRKELEMRFAERDGRVLEAYKKAKDRKKEIENYVEGKTEFIDNYKKASNTANATIDDNSNVGNKNIGVLNAEIHKGDNIQISRAMVTKKLKELYPKFNSKKYVQDLENHICYKHDESSFGGAIAPYCTSITMYPFLTDGIHKLGGLSAAPKNLDSFCGMFCNLVFAISSQYAGAVAVSEALLYFTYFCKKEWGDDFYLHPDTVISQNTLKEKTIRSEIHQRWQQIIYTLGQPSGSRNCQAPFINFSYFDHPFFEGMFGDFYFPDGTKPDWESLKWTQMEFMQWFNNERLKCMLTFPVESFTLLYKDGEFIDKEMYDFVCEEYARGHSFFTYISDSVDSLSSCCFSGDTEVMYMDCDSKSLVYSSFADAYDRSKGKRIKAIGYNPYTEKYADEGVYGKFVKYKTEELYYLFAGDGDRKTKITATKDHIFPVSSADGKCDKYVKDLKVGDRLIAENFHWGDDADEKTHGEVEVEINGIQQVCKSCDVYCIELEDEDSPYFVLPNGIITHNCRLKNKIQTKEFNFTNGNIGVMTGSKSVITLNMNRIVQDWYCKEFNAEKGILADIKLTDELYASLKEKIGRILDRVYMYHNAYNELLWDMYDAKLLPVYSAGFIDLNKQYLTIGINGLNQAAEFLGMKCNDNPDYMKFCQEIFSEVKRQNLLHKVSEGKHKLTFNTEQVPAESLAIKNYNWDKEDGYWVPDDTNLYASYVYKPNDKTVSILEKIRLMGSNYIGEWIDGGAAAHLNIEEHLTKQQYEYILKYAAENGCQYLTFNCPNCVCDDCGFIAKQPFEKCPKCGSANISLWDRIIGYLTKIKNWSEGRQIEQKTRYYEKISENGN